MIVIIRYVVIVRVFVSGMVGLGVDCVDGLFGVGLLVAVCDGVDVGGCVGVAVG